jgi:predicted MFS family arabinose efflux permease
MHHRPFASRQTDMPLAPKVLPMTSRSTEKRGWSAVLAMSLAAFALVASEFMPVSLLTPIAAELHITEGQAGQGISVSGAFALVTSLVIAAIATRVERKKLLLCLTLLMILSGTVVALAPGYPSFMLGRALIGIAIGGFWSLSAATAMRLVPPDQVSRALAIVNGGNALATVIAAPAGSFLGSLIGWRGAFFCVVPVAVFAAVWLLISLPSFKGERHTGSGNALRLMKQLPVALGMVAVSVFFMGQFMLFTYLRPFLEGVTGVSVSTLSFMLLSLGLAGFVGTFVIERFIGNGLYRTLTVIPLIMAIIALALVNFGASPLLTAVLLGVWGLVATAAPVGWWTWLAQTLPDDAEAGGGLLVAIVQLAIAAGAIIGGLAFDLSGYKTTFELSATVLVVASVLAWLAGRNATEVHVSEPNATA